MSNEISILNIIILAANVGIIYWTLIHNKKKDFEDQLFKEKFDTYKQLIDSSYDALKALDINSDPFRKIYDIKDKAEWQEYFQKEVSKLYKIGFGLEDNIRKKSIYLPATVVDKFIEYSHLCMGYVTNCYHYDTGVIIDCQDRLSDLFFDLVNEIRSDLNIDLIDESLKTRIFKNMN
jgi:hypothetical protein